MCPPQVRTRGQSYPCGAPQLDHRASPPSANSKSRALTDGITDVSVARRRVPSHRTAPSDPHRMLDREPPHAPQPTPSHRTEPPARRPDRQPRTRQSTAMRRSSLIRRQSARRAPRTRRSSPRPPGHRPKAKHGHGGGHGQDGHVGSAHIPPISSLRRSERWSQGHRGRPWSKHEPHHSPLARRLLARGRVNKPSRRIHDHASSPRRDARGCSDHAAGQRRCLLAETRPGIGSPSVAEGGVQTGRIVATVDLVEHRSGGEVGSRGR
jgi:hypothetical protein